MRYLPILCLMLVLVTVETRAHDLWLLPDTNPTVADKLIVLARQGMDFPKRAPMP